MKLVLAIIHDDDAMSIMKLLNEKGYFVTKLATTGGFLRAGNTTLITGVDDNDVSNVIEIFETRCKSRIQKTDLSAPYGAMEGYKPYPIEVKVGGATIFVLDVEQFKKF